MADESGWEDDRISGDFITVYELKKIHRRLIDAGHEHEASLRDAMRDEATLEFIVMEANRVTSPVERAAFLMHRIATRHPFIEGNKRTAFLAADGTLRVHAKMRINDSPKNIYEFISKVASGNKEEYEIVSWLETVVVSLIH